MAAIYFLLKMLEMKFVDKEFKPLKYVIRDTVYVFISGLLCLFVFLNLNGSIDNFRMLLLIINLLLVLQSQRTWVLNMVFFIIYSI